MTVSDLRDAGLDALTPVVAGFTAALGLEGLAPAALEPLADPAAALPPDAPLTVRTPIHSDALGGEVVVLIGDEASERVVYAAADTEVLTEALVPALTEALRGLATAAGAVVEGGDPVEHPTADTAAWTADAEVVLGAPILDGDEHVATVVLALRFPAPAVAEAADDSPGYAAAEFPPIAEPGAGVGDGPLALLRDVEMEVTAELGRTRMTVQELLGLLPGSIVELDKVAGSPVDLLVNGTLIARGEVVVIDEEYGVRVIEIVTQAAGITS